MKIHDIINEQGTTASAVAAIPMAIVPGPAGIISRKGTTPNKSKKIGTGIYEAPPSRGVKTTSDMEQMVQNKAEVFNKPIPLVYKRMPIEELQQEAEKAIRARNKRRIEQIRWEIQRRAMASRLEPDASYTISDPENIRREGSGRK